MTLASAPLVYDWGRDWPYAVWIQPEELEDWDGWEEGDMSAYRCSSCGTNWPVHSDYATCPSCDQRTWISMQEPIDAEDAWSTMTHVKFERFYQEREAARLAKQSEDEARAFADEMTQRMSAIEES